MNKTRLRRLSEPKGIIAVELIREAVARAKKRDEHRQIERDANRVLPDAIRSGLDRDTLIDVMGGACNRCGFDDRRALQIDHVRGGGMRELRLLGASSSAYYNKVLRSVAENRGEYQLLCANCNWVKRSENSEVTRRKAVR